MQDLYKVKSFYSLKLVLKYWIRVEKAEKNVKR